MALNKIVSGLDLLLVIIVLVGCPYALFHSYWYVLFRTMD